MNLAELSSNGQVTIPAEIRKQLNLQAGDEILFVTTPDGEVLIRNASPKSVSRNLLALDKIQTIFAQEAPDLCQISEDEVQEIINQIRDGS